MTPSEVINAFIKAEKELQPVFDFINAGHIVPNDGVLSYLYGTSQLRSNDLRDAISQLRVTTMQYAREKEKFNG